MAAYLYHCYVYHDTSGVLGVTPAVEAANTLDFETNYKSLAIEIDDLIPAETTYEIIKTYTQFKALIVSPITWGDVRYADEGKAYDIYLLSSNPL